MPKKLISIEEMMVLINRARPTLWKMVDRGDFPQPVKIGKRTIGWTEEAYDNWITENSKG